jgi:hypothetical protein
MGGSRFVIMLKSFSGYEQNQSSSVLHPTLVEVDQKIEKQRPLLGLSPGIEKAPRLAVVRGRCPASSFEQRK